jgi:hypothetical protein
MELKGNFEQKAGQILAKNLVLIYQKIGPFLADCRKRKRYQNNGIFHLTATILGVIFECKLTRVKR